MTRLLQRFAPPSSRPDGSSVSRACPARRASYDGHPSNYGALFCGLDGPRSRLQRAGMAAPVITGKVQRDAQRSTFPRANGPVSTATAELAREVEPSLSNVIRASRISERHLEGIADVSVLLMNPQVSSISRVHPSTRPAAQRKTGRATHPNNETAGQAPFSAGSKIATHSTCAVIGKTLAWAIHGKAQVRHHFSARHPACGYLERQTSVTADSR